MLPRCMLSLPLFLQLVSKQADVGHNLFTLLLLQLLLAYTVTAAADARGLQAKTHASNVDKRQNKLKDQRFMPGNKSTHLYRRGADNRCLHAYL